jgi:drug/metabolite transporter (DMT)-like permease
MIYRGAVSIVKRPSRASASPSESIATVPSVTTRKPHPIMSDSVLPSTALVAFFASCYVLSGVCQPLLMTVCKEAGLADPTAQLYMVFYYAGPASLGFCSSSSASSTSHSSPPSARSSFRKQLQASGIALFDIGAQAMNYTGATLAGPTLFAIIYSSVTVWTAVFSRLLFARRIRPIQWISVWTVFFGLTITAWGGIQTGNDVAHGTLLILVGSIMHAATYVLSEAVMDGPDGLTISQNTAVQGAVAFLALGAWQILYTAPHWHALLQQPLHEAGTSALRATLILFAFALANLVHSWTFYHTIKHAAGGATTAGVLKGLQAVLVMVAAHILYCGSYGGHEMCFTRAKFLSLFLVVGGVLLFGAATPTRSNNNLVLTTRTAWKRPQGYEAVDNQEEAEEMTVV